MQLQFEIHLALAGPDTVYMTVLFVAPHMV